MVPAKRHVDVCRARFDPRGGGRWQEFDGRTGGVHEVMLFRRPAVSKQSGPGDSRESPGLSVWFSRPPTTGR
ncbi:hypothetical protein FRUB_03530 [Fimbriiglobus ruber]|uniref:Uncharacterized protein n=1 Tax=Fimbriiglobus ruber TaxID=1908690 RepID=A0A225DRK2_9BACT|nr:hypothetical protein FRUB_03530 [Fimbriiglobus ruber]